MSDLFSQRLAILIDAKTAGAVTEVQKLAKTQEQQALSADKASAANAKYTASVDKEAVSLAKLNLEQAKAAGTGGGKGSAEADALAAAQQKASVSKAASGLASDRLAVSEAKASAAAKDLGNETSVASGLLGKMGISGDAAAAGLAKVAPAIIALGAFKVLSDGIKNFETLTAQIRTFQGVAGGTAQQDSLLVGEMNALGIDTDAAGKAFFKLGSSLGDGTSKLSAAGVATAHLKEGTTDVIGTFENARRAYQSSTDAAQRDAIAKDLAGKGAAALIPLLRLNVDQVKALDAATRARGEVFTQKELQSGRDLKVASAELGLSVQGLEISLSKGVVPALADAAGLASKLVDSATKLDNVTGGALSGEAVTKALSSAYDKLTGSAGGASKAQAESNLKSQQATKAQDDLTKATLADFSATKQMESANQTLTDALQSQVDAQKALEKLQKAGPVDLKAVASAQKEVTTAAKDLDTALDSQAKAQDALKKATAGATAEELAQAQLDVAEGPNKLAAANAKVLAAQEKLGALRGTGSASASELAQAEADVQDAVFGVTQAQIDAAKAQDNLTTVKAKGTKADPAVVSAQQSVRDAADNVAAALDRQKTAADNLRTAQAGDPAFNDNLAAAQRGVASAGRAVANAQDGQMTAAYNLQRQTDILNASLSTNAGQIGEVAGALAAFPGYEKILGDATAAAGGVDALNRALAAQDATAKQAASGNGGLIGQAKQILSGGGATEQTGSILRPRAGEGPVVPGGKYLVGENTPEILTLGPDGRGFVNRVPGRSGPGAQGGSGSFVYQPSVTVHASTGATAAEIAREAAWTLQTLPPPPPRSQP